MRDFIFSVFALAAAVAAAEPVLHGDGVNDDTDAIQAMIDAGKGIVKLPKPARHYLISRTLQFGDGTGLELDRDTRILLAPGSSCPLARNRKADAEGDRDLNLSISIVGGIWDMDNVRQAPNPRWRHAAEPPLPPVVIPERYESGFYRGNAFYFENVSNLVVRGVTIRNPVTYGFQMCRVRFFEIEDVTLDYTTCNPIFGNMDGIHLDGGCFRGRISGVRGSAGDDLVALNANDGICAAHEEPITDIEIENLHSDYAHSAVRILSAPAPVERIRISNVTGSYYVYAVGFTHYFPTRHENGFIKDVVLRNIDVAMTAVRPDKWTARPRGPIFFDTDLRIENVLFDGVRLSPGVRVSERFGYDPNDSWKSLQAALDSGLPRIIIDRQEEPWQVSKPLVGRSNQEIVFERGVEIRPVCGGRGDVFLSYAGCTNVTLCGDAVFRLRASGWRHALSVRSCRNVRLAGLTFDGAGVRVVSAEDLILEGCIVDGAPADGVCFEPEGPADRLRNCVLRGCTVSGSAGCGIGMALGVLGRGAGNLSILVDDCDLVENALGSHRLQVPRADASDSPQGPIAFWNVRSREKGGEVKSVNFTEVLGSNHKTEVN